MEKLNIPVILGSSRSERYSKKVGDLVYKISKEFEEIQTHFVDVANFNLTFDDDKPIPEFHAIVESADAFFIVFPEYNHYLPGKLKTLLDTEFKLYKHKPLATASVSDGPMGGVRASEASMPFFVVLGMIVTGINVRFPKVKEAFDEAGNPINPKQADLVREAFKKLIYITKVVKAGKETVDGV